MMTWIFASSWPGEESVIVLPCTKFLSKDTYIEEAKFNFLKQSLIF